MKYWTLIATAVIALLIVWLAPRPTLRDSAPPASQTSLPHAALPVGESSSTPKTQESLASESSPSHHLADATTKPGTTFVAQSPVPIRKCRALWKEKPTDRTDLQFVLDCYVRRYNDHSDRMLRAVEAAYGAEHRDEAWAAPLESRIGETVAQVEGVTMVDGDCRTSICRFVLSLSHPVNLGIGLSNFHSALLNRVRGTGSDVFFAHKLPASQMDGFDRFNQPPPSTLAITSGEDALYLFRATTPAAYVDTLSKLLQEDEDKGT